MKKSMKVLFVFFLPYLNAFLSLAITDFVRPKNLAKMQIRDMMYYKPLMVLT